MTIVEIKHDYHHISKKKAGEVMTLKGCGIGVETAA
jgi:hypothetical protein